MLFSSSFRRIRRLLLGASGVTFAVMAGTAVAATSPELFPHSAFDHSVTQLPVTADSATLVSNLVHQYQTNYGSIGVNRMPIFTVPANQPLVSVSVRPGCWSFLGANNEVPIPAGAYTGGGTDLDMIISQPSTGRDWELWRASQDSSGNWSACWGGSLLSSTSSGVFPGNLGLSATGLSYLATTITEADVASGQINHAIAMQIVNCNGFVAPAVRGDCGSNPGTPPEGTQFRLAANTPMPAGLTPFAQMVFRAIQNYGLVVIDHAGAVMIQAETSADWAFQGGTGVDPITNSFAGKPQYAVLNGMPWSQLQVVGNG